MNIQWTIRISLLLCLSTSAQIFSEDFNAYSGNQNSTQVNTNLEVAFGGTLPGWTGSGAGAIHAVDLANTGGQSNPSDWAMMFFRDNVITSSAIAANDGGASYQVIFSAGPAVYAAAGQATAAGDGLIIDDPTRGQCHCYSHSSPRCLGWLTGLECGQL